MFTFEIGATLILCNSHEKISNFLQSEEPPLSFYGVYDGHAGKDAAAFAASHLHGRIISSPNYPTDPVAAIKDAFNKTDEAFLDKVSETSDIINLTYYFLCYASSRD